MSEKLEKFRTYAEYLVEKMSKSFKDEVVQGKKLQEKPHEKTTESKYIKWLSELNKNDIPVAGGKGANLAEMYNLGLPVPPAFVITAQAFEYFLQAIRQEKINFIIKNIDIENTKQLEEKAREIQELVKNAKMPDDLKDAIIESYNNLYVDTEALKTASTDVLAILKSAREPCFVAVRSSATTEDLASVSENDYALVKVDGKPVYDKISEIYNKFNNSNLEVPSMKNNKIVWAKVGQIYKHKADNVKLYKIETEKGREITVSPNHSLIILDEDTLKPRTTSINKLKNTDLIPAIATLPEINQKIKEIDILHYIDGESVIECDNKIKIKNKSSNWKIQHGLQRKIPLTNNFAYFLGLFVAEGSTYKNNTVILTNSSTKVMCKIKEFLKSLGLYTSQKINKNSLRVYCKSLVKLLHTLVGEPLNKKGKGRSCHIKKVPNFIFGCKREFIGKFLQGCFDGDGYVGKNILSYTSTSRALSGGIVKLLEIFGIGFFLRRENDHWKILIPLHEIKKFKESIGFTEPSKLKRLYKLIASYDKREVHPRFKDNLFISQAFSTFLRKKLETTLPKERIEIALCPICNKKIEKTSYYKRKLRYCCRNCRNTFYEQQVKKKKIKCYVNYDPKGRFTSQSIPWNKQRLMKKRFTKKEFKKLIQKYNLIEFSDLLNDSVEWDQIKKVTPINYSDYIYDFTVPRTENFAAGIGGIITHNTASFAGQQETFLNVKGNAELLEAVKKCFASLFTARAIYYRHRKGFSHEKALIAVIVERMIDSDKSGVVFTVNPTTNKDEIVIEAVFGLGEGVVSGAVMPDSYIVNKNSLKIEEKHIGQKDMFFTRNSAGKTIKQDLHISKRNMQVLNDYEIKQLTNYSIDIEQHYKHPQDIEFAIEAGHVYIVQTRPVTTLGKEVKKVEFKATLLLEGTAASPGIASGIVKIVKSMEDLDKIKSGDVLVTKMTNPDMVVTMQKARAIVTSEGGSTCFEGSTKILTNKGFMEIREAVRRIKENEKLVVFSYDYKNLKPKWKKIVGGGSRVADIIRVGVSQTGKMKNNYLDLTPDHKIFTFENRKMVKKEICNILKNGEMLCLVDSLPKIENFTNYKLAYINGAILSDGNVRIDYYHTGNPRRGRITLTQKEEGNKKEFIQTFRNYFYDVFGERLSERLKDGYSSINGRLISGFATDFVCNNLVVALLFTKINQNLSEWCLQLDELSSLNFLAGLIDGDGSFCNNRINIYVSKDNVLQGIIISCLKLGVIPQVTSNRNIYNVQLVERMDDILRFCKKITISPKAKLMGTKLFSAKQILADIIDKVNWKGRIKPYVKNNLLIDSRKVKERILSLCSSKVKKEIEKIVSSSTRMHRVKKIIEFGKTEVFNIQVEADNEIDHNYIVFTKRYSPILVSNSHAAIVSREMGIACVTGTKKALEILKDGQLITVDGTSGRVYEGKVTVEEQQIKILPIVPTKTKIKVIIDLPDFAARTAETKAEGIGLLRLEGIIASAKKHPLQYLRENKAEEYQNLLFEGIKKIVGYFPNKEAWIRTSDIRSDEFQHLQGSPEVEANPMLGMHGIRFSLANAKLLEAELKAIKQIAEQGFKSGVMLPQVISVDEVRRVKDILQELEMLNEVKFGVMIETPAAVEVIEDLCKEGIDFISFGTNDLTQYTLAIDRGNEKVQFLYDEMHPAILSQLEKVIDVCKQYNVETSICGQAASKKEMVEWLVKHGIDSISVNADAAYEISKFVSEIEVQLGQQQEQAPEKETAKEIEEGTAKKEEIEESKIKTYEEEEAEEQAEIEEKLEPEAMFEESMKAANEHIAEEIPREDVEKLERKMEETGLKDIVSKSDNIEPEEKQEEQNNSETRLNIF